MRETLRNSLLFPNIPPVSVVHSGWVSGVGLWLVSFFLDLFGGGVFFFFSFLWGGGFFLVGGI